MIHDLVCVFVGVLLCGIAFAVWEWISNRPKPHRFGGDYRDPRSEFQIIAPRPVEERSDARVDRTAQRLGRLKRRQYADAPE